MHQPAPGFEAGGRVLDGLAGEKVGGGDEGERMGVGEQRFEARAMVGLATGKRMPVLQPNTLLRK